MANSNVTTLPPIDVLGHAAATLSEQAGSDLAHVRALNKAQYHLALGDVAIVHGGDGFMVTSATRAGVVHKVSHLAGCDCEAARSGKACWHAAAIAILEEAAKYRMPKVETASYKAPMAQRIAAERFARAKAAMDELYF